jgi:hypothetical protein
LPFARACSYDRETSLSRVAIDAQDRAARGLPVRIVDMNDQLCDTPRCQVVRNGVVVFTDDNHLTASVSRSLAMVLGQRIAAAMDAPVRTGALARRTGSTTPMRPETERGAAPRDRL